MGQKDISQKQLLHHRDVFADVLNALIFGGSRMIYHRDLLGAPTEAFFKDDKDILHNTLSDIAYYEVKNESVKVCYVIENQTERDDKMALRKAGVVGGILKQQYRQNETYPVIHIVLYWGDEKWEAANSLLDLCDTKAIPVQAIGYIDDINVHVFDMMHLPKETINYFKRDMRAVMEILHAEDESAISGFAVKYPEDVADFLYAIKGVNYYGHLIWEKGGKSMITTKSIFDIRWDEGFEAGIEKGIEKGEENVYKILTILKKENCLEDFERAFKDKEYRERLLSRAAKND